MFPFNMLSPNNPELDPDLLSEKLRTVAANRRRPQPLFLKPKAAEFTPGIDYSYQTKGIRALIKRIPLLGSFAVALNRRMRQVTFPGLTWKQRVLLVPLVGPAVHWIYAIVRLNKIRHEVTQQLIDLRQLQQAANQRIDQIAALDIENRLRRFDTLDIGNRLTHADRRIYELEAAMRSVLVLDAERENRIAGLQQELHRHMHTTALAATANAARVDSAPSQASRTAAPGFDADAFYTEFERKFRGSREDILERLKVYLPYLANFRSDPDALVIDIGCGRGEWLELLSGEGCKAVGVDMNSAMVATCRERGLAAECDDAIAYLRRQPEGSVAAVTGFHIIEHLPFETLIALFDAALHALRRDGFIIFETPNPENLTVGACNFYTDPTHLHPIVPAVAEFMARQRGFARAEILRLHPYPDNMQLADDSDVARRVNRALYGPQDFAVIAWKSYAN
ncbi:class I SAM-dependent methyltransferase [Herbaspirillum sp. HC18]|nr:class I SAM-dependent methyltransferase [Herbaspirillum sp. HC18]